MAVLSAFLEILRRPTTGEIVCELMEFMMPIWVAVLVGVLVGWTWKPNWAKLNDSNKSGVVFSQFASSLSSLKQQVPTCISRVFDLGASDDCTLFSSASSSDGCSLLQVENKKSGPVNVYDLHHLHRLVEEKDDGPVWIQVMDKSTARMSYQAWRRDPEIGPPQYRSRTVYEDATPEMLRDFFWDDEFRMKWDDMFIHAETLEECPLTGTMVVQWVRKFPFFCSNREYIIGRRIWQSGQAFYCVTKGVPCSTVPRRNKPRRVDLYYSSWCIRAAESKSDGRPTACEVLLFHHEDMGIPWEIAKLGVRKGMWGAVKKIDPGLRAYQEHRASGAPLSRSAYMAQVNTKVNIGSLEDTEITSDTSDSKPLVGVDKPLGRGIPKFLVIGGAIAVACTIDRGLMTKAFIFGIARRFARAG